MFEGAQVGSYRILKQIGEGGMGSVYLAEHVMLGRRAAIKVLQPAFSQRQEIVTRFFNEARAATAISDPGIVQIFDFGHHTDGSAYIVMELLDGEPLDNRLRRVGAMRVEDVLRIIRQVASSVGAAHARSIVHRDLKPENIFLVRDPEVPGGERAKVLDFGIAKLMDDQAGGQRTQASLLIGTPDYMSPEQCRGAGKVDQRSDIYSLGCVMYRLLTGQAPYSGATGELIMMHMTSPPPSLSTVLPNAPADVDQLLQRCMAKDPAHRPRSGTEMAAEIDAILARRSVPGFQAAPAMAPTMTPAPYGSPTPAPYGSPTPAPYGGPTPTPMHHTPAPGHHTTLSSSAVAITAGTQAPATSKKPIVIGAVAALVVGGGLVAWKLSSKKSEPTAAPVAEPVKPDPAPAPEPAPQPAPPPPDERPRKAEEQLAGALATFKRWSATHAGAPCPDAATLGLAKDPWDHDLAITCTEQPDDQMIGVTSAGADGKPGTDDDVVSWKLGDRTTAIVLGSRWAAVATTAAKPTKPTTTTRPKPTRPKPSGGGEFVDTDGDGIPDRR